MHNKNNFLGGQEDILAALAHLLLNRIKYHTHSLILYTLYSIIVYIVLV